MKKTALFSSILLSSLSAADSDTSNVRLSKSQAIELSTAFGSPILVPISQKNALSPSSEVYQIKSRCGTCTYSTFTSDDFDDVCTRSRSLDGAETFVDQSVFLEKVAKTLPSTTKGLIYDPLVARAIDSLTQLEISTEDFVATNDLSILNIDKNRTIFFIFAMTASEFNSSVAEFYQFIRNSELSDNNFIFANILQIKKKTAPNSTPIERRIASRGASSLSSSSTPTSAHDKEKTVWIEVDDAIFPMEFDE